MRKLAIALICTAWLAAPVQAQQAAQTMSPLPPNANMQPVSADLQSGAKPGSPFGSNLFGGKFAADTLLNTSPNYRLKPGDQVAIAMWGGMEPAAGAGSDGTTTVPVDAQGMIFIPGVGPVKVAGVMQSELNDVVSRHVSTYYQDSVKVYSSLKGAHGLSVYVTGGVVSPGRYSGDGSDSLLQYLDRAKGIDPERGSYRTVDVIRGGEKIASIDIYEFLMRGMMPAIPLKENDVIFVHGLGHTVMVGGAVQNPYRFEFTQPTLMGSELIAMARPTPLATHAIVTGIRDGQGFSNYLSLADLATTDIRQGDAVEFKAGTLTATLTVNIDGEHLGPQVVVAPANAKLSEVLRHVRIDRELADIDSIYLMRKSVAKRQKDALDDSLRRLEESILAARPQNEADARIQTEEAKLVQMFVARAKEVEPEGRVVVSESGELRDISLEDGDTIVIPRKTNLVMVNGEVSMPKAVVYREGEGPSYYINKAGGYSERADEDKLVIARQNGETVANSSDVRPGDEIIVMPEVGFSQLQVTKDVVDILYKVAIAIAVPLQL